MYVNMRLIIKYLLFWLLSCAIAKVIDECEFASNEPGFTSPCFVEANVGDSFNITCKLNSSLMQDKSKTFTFLERNTSKRVPNLDVAYPDDTTLVYMIRNATKQRSTYWCGRETDRIAYADVYVGTPPLPVQDFECHSYNFENVTCTFVEQDNPVNTKYNLSYSIDSDIYFYPVKCDFQHRPRFVCTNYLLPQHYEIYKFKLQGVNSLGERIESFNVNILDNMELSINVDDFFKKSISWNSIEVSWRILKWHHIYRRELQWEILLTPDNLPVLNLTLSAKVLNINENFTLSLSNLLYANYWYELRMRVKINSTSAANWSKPFIYRFKTDGHRPRAPRMQPGSFYMDSSERELRIYWEELDPIEYSGENFTYLISNIWKNGIPLERELEHVRQEWNSALTRWEKDQHYRFAVRSRNHVGTSPDASYLEVFPIANRNPAHYKPNSVYSAFNKTSNSYVISWNGPDVLDKLVNYTAFWCFPRPAMQNECNGSIHFAVLPINATMFHVISQKGKPLIMGISANYLDYNTGIQWASCNGEFNSNLVKIKLELHPSATSILVKWSTPVCPSILAEYQLFYCSVEEEICADERKIIIGREKRSYTISKLKPYTKYNVTMLMRSFTKSGDRSTPVFSRTQQAPPSPPRQLQVSDITNTTATLSWLPPSHPNGQITAYIIHVGTGEITVAPQTDELNGKIVYKLTNLTNYTMFKVYVLARNIEKSNSSNDVHFTTKVGYPSKPEHVEMQVDKGKLYWTKPAMPNGRVDCYEVYIARLRQNEVHDQRISVLCGKMSCELPTPSCHHEKDQIIVDVRAVNAAHYPKEVTELEHSNVLQHSSTAEKYYTGNDDLECVNTTVVNAITMEDYFNSSIYVLYMSNWHRAWTHLCAENRGVHVWPFLVALVFLAVFSIMFVFVHRKLKEMSNIKCALPPSLDAYPLTESLPSEQSTGDEELPHQTFAVHNERCNFLNSLSIDNLLKETGSVVDAGGLDNYNSKLGVESNEETEVSEKESDTSVLASCNDGIYIPVESLNISSPKMNNNSYNLAAYIQGVGWSNEN